MNRDQIEGKWKQFKGEVKKTWGRLTDDDLAHAEGDVDSIAGRIQERYGEAKEKVKQKLDALLHRIQGTKEPPASAPRPGQTIEPRANEPPKRDVA